MENGNGRLERAIVVLTQVTTMAMDRMTLLTYLYTRSDFMIAEIKQLVDGSAASDDEKQQIKGRVEALKVDLDRLSEADDAMPKGMKVTAAEVKKLVKDQQDLRELRSQLANTPTSQPSAAAPAASAGTASPPSSKWKWVAIVLAAVVVVAAIAVPGFLYYQEKNQPEQGTAAAQADTAEKDPYEGYPALQKLTQEKK
ncbi:MAG: hypothetical protein WEC84_00750 [Candidatus Andersenbacteria bacterium]